MRQPASAPAVSQKVPEIFCCTLSMRRSRAPERAQRAQQDVPFRPQYAVPPGETLLETLEVLGMSQAELAEPSAPVARTHNWWQNSRA